MRPNTKEWLAALEATNPEHAAITRLAVERAGGFVDVCSVCGALPSREYVNPTLQVAPRTIRFCDDCLRIRKEMRSEPWEPLVVPK